METTIGLLDAVKARYALPSDYALAGKLKITRSMVSAYRQGKRLLGDETALKVAELLELDPGYVLACMEAERTHSEAARKAWERTADRLEALARREASGECILCKIGRHPSFGLLHDFPTLHPGVIQAAMGSFYRPAHA